MKITIIIMIPFTFTFTIIIMILIGLTNQDGVLQSDLRATGRQEQVQAGDQLSAQAQVQRDHHVGHLHIDLYNDVDDCGDFKNNSLLFVCLLFVFVLVSFLCVLCH